MSADNFNIVSQCPDDGRWYLYDGYASAPDDHVFQPSRTARSFDTELDALHAGAAEWTEYGTRTAPWPGWDETSERMAAFRKHVIDNLFDGDASGLRTQPATYLVEDIVDIAFEWFDNEDAS